MTKSSPERVQRKQVTSVEIQQQAGLKNNPAVYANGFYVKREGGVLIVSLSYHEGDKMTLRGAFALPDGVGQQLAEVLAKQYPRPDGKTNGK